jgi:hypothetical protein
MNAIVKLVCGLFTGLAIAACGASATSEPSESNGADLTSAPAAANASTPNAVACISKEDGPCGGFVAHPCTCAPGLKCVPNRIPDVPGTCQPEKCCPLDWQMYPCMDGDRDTDYNCHNPQLACASSLTCGGGCDFQVYGRCPVPPPQ